MQPKVYTYSEHNIDQSLIDKDALYILDKLKHAGHKAYLVGGSVRDLLTDRQPKDFDISTDALPEEIKKIFQRKCILIGRRFRLAHIRFGKKIIEVSTFRSGENVSDLITHDNVWGDEEDDVLRRDFTINGLYYDSCNKEIIDYVAGVEDIQKNLIRTIGEPSVRFKQDPVRLIRLIKFQARFGFEIESSALEALHDCSEEIRKSSPARVLEEFLRMLESGHAAKFLNLMSKYGLLDILFPQIATFIQFPEGKKIFHYLAAADQLIQHNKSQKQSVTLDRSILVACLIFPALELEIQKKYTEQELLPHIGDITATTNSLVKTFLIDSFRHFPRKITTYTASILVTQFRLTPLTKKRQSLEKVFKLKDFNDAFKFFKLRAMVGLDLVEKYNSLKDKLNLFRKKTKKK